ncbi:MAG TPA: YCF48-related protein [Ktedonobacteraceae bacterium]|nr:YCF48-related protein [Ktedonobacteraceae bacterium]
MTELYVATGDGVAHITQHGETWTVETQLKDSEVQCLVLDPHHPGTIYAGSQGKGVLKSSDGGIHWQDTHLPQQDVFSLAVSPVDGTVYAGCEPSMLFRSTDGGQSWQELAALRSIPSAPTWSFPPRPWTSHVRWIAPNPHDAALLIVGIELGGLMYSSDGGQTWTDHRPNAQRDVHALAWHPTAQGRAYEAGGGGSAWSRDGGKTWQRLDTGRDRHYTWGLAVNHDDPDCWYISACPGPREAHNPHGNAQAYIYRWRGNGPWQALNGGLPQPLKSFPYALASTPGQLYAGLGDGSLYVSHDAGDSWQQMTLGGDPVSRILAIACVS